MRAWPGRFATVRARRAPVKEGAPAEHVYLLTSGAVRVMRGNRASGKGALLWLSAAPALIGVEEALRQNLEGLNKLFPAE